MKVKDINRKEEIVDAASEDEFDKGPLDFGDGLLDDDSASIEEDVTLHERIASLMH